jgi:hypothetical protein
MVQASNFLQNPVANPLIIVAGFGVQRSGKIFCDFLLNTER